MNKQKHAQIKRITMLTYTYQQKSTMNLYENYRCADLHTHPVSALDDPATLTFDLRINACQGPAVEYMSIDFKVDCSSHFLFRVQRDRTTDTYMPTDHPTHTSTTAGTSIKLSRNTTNRKCDIINSKSLEYVNVIFKNTN